MKNRFWILWIVFIIITESCGSIFSKRSNYISIVTPTEQDTVGLHEMLKRWTLEGRKWDTAQVDTKYVNQFISKPIIYGIRSFDYIVGIENLSTPDTSILVLEIKGGFDVNTVMLHIDSTLNHSIVYNLPKNLKNSPYVIKGRAGRKR